MKKMAHPTAMAPNASQVSNVAISCRILSRVFCTSHAVCSRLDDANRSASVPMAAARQWYTSQRTGEDLKIFDTGTITRLLFDFGPLL
jgi:hypothetical protein